MTYCIREVRSLSTASRKASWEGRRLLEAEISEELQLCGKGRLLATERVILTSRRALEASSQRLDVSPAFFCLIPRVGVQRSTEIKDRRTNKHKVNQKERKGQDLLNHDEGQPDVLLPIMSEGKTLYQQKGKRCPGEVHHCIKLWNTGASHPELWKM